VNESRHLANCREPGIPRAYALAVVLFLGFAGCGHADDAAVVLTFDDAFVEQWHDQRSVFVEYGARVSFMVTRFDSLGEEQISMLRDLEGDGHEIGCHSLTHVDPREFLAEHTVEEYVDAEITPALELMAAAGFEPTSFSYPWGGRSGELDVALWEQFEILRGSGGIGSDGLYDYAGDPLVFGARVDDGYATIDEVEEAMRRARGDGSALVLYTHRVLEESEASHIKPDDLEELLARATELDLPLKTLSELVR